MSMTFNGKPFNASSFQNELMSAAVDAVKEELFDRFASRRDPRSGEFPTVRVFGDEFEDIRLKIEGSQALIEHIKSGLSDEDREVTFFMTVNRIGPPKAFLSYSFDDRDLAKSIANALMANGIDTWWAEWEIRAGDSLRQLIDEGLSGCSHFIVLMTPGSIQKPWVRQEMDAGLVRRIDGQAKFLPLRSGLPTKDLPPLLSGMLSPEIGDDFVASIRNLVNDIHDVGRKPPLGPAPAATQLPDTGYSKTATGIAQIFVEATQDATFADPQQSIDELAEMLDASREDIIDALYELRDFVKETHDQVLPLPDLFSEFDGHFKEWSPETDALRLAADMLNDPNFPYHPAVIAAHYGWEPRRLNPAIAFLETRKLVSVYDGMGTMPFNVHRVTATDATRRYVKSRI